jgi:AmmeMemoRadiSam system protein B
MTNAPVRPAAVAGSWYPGTREGLARLVDGFLSAASCSVPGRIAAIVAPHAGLVYSGPVAAFAYSALAGRQYEVAVLVGPSHHVAFDGVAVYPRGAWATPYGDVPVDEDVAHALVRAASVVHESPGMHAREHSLEIQLPFLCRVLPDVPIVPLLMGYQWRPAIDDLARALGQALAGRRALMVASTDLSHYHDRRAASRLDGQVTELVAAFDADGLAREIEEVPDHACGGGPTVAVMKAARVLGARDARVLRYADSGDVSGDTSAVVGYMAAALGVFDDAEGRA